MHECIPYETSEAFGDGFIRSERWVYIHGWMNGIGYTISSDGSPFNLTFPIWRLPECINAFPTNKLRVRRERIYPFRKVGIHPRLDEWYWLHNFIQQFLIQPNIPDTEAAGMHECIPYEAYRHFASISACAGIGESVTLLVGFKRGNT